MWYTHTHPHPHPHTMEYYSAIKRTKKMPVLATWMELKILILSEGSQKQKDKYK